MRIAIVGSRSFNDWEYMKQIMTWVTVPYPVWDIDAIISGGAKGADTLAERVAHELGLRLIVHRAEWDKYGKSAGYRRNKLIVDDANLILAFWDGESKGTAHTIKLAEEAGKTVHVFTDWNKNGKVSKFSNPTETNNF